MRGNDMPPADGSFGKSSQSSAGELTMVGMIRENWQADQLSY